jgi:hypothetical protein
VISGMDAAKALTGSRQPIPGRGTKWMRSGSQDLPAYVEFGGRATAPAPFACEAGLLKGLLLRGDARRIEALVERMFNAPAGATTEYRALGSRVLLLIGSFGRVTSLTPPFDRWGAVRETQASFFIPVVAGRDMGGVFVADRLLLAVPYIFVDNPMSYLGGRETYGYAKTMARFTPADGLGDRTVVHAFGGDFGRDQGAAWREFMSIEATGARLVPRIEQETSGLRGLLRHLAGDLSALEDQGELVVAGLRLPASLLTALDECSITQVFLKQFRDATDGTRACYQAVVEAPVRVDRVITRPAEYDHEVRLERLDSHPIDLELGLKGRQRAVVSFEAEMDFVVDEGYEVSRIAAPSGVAPPPTYVSGDGYTSLIETAARWVWKEITALERASIGRFRRP